MLRLSHVLGFVVLAEIGWVSRAPRQMASAENPSKNMGNFSIVLLALQAVYKWYLSLAEIFRMSQVPARLAGGSK